MPHQRPDPMGLPTMTFQRGMDRRFFTKKNLKHFEDTRTGLTL